MITQELYDFYVRNKYKIVFSPGYSAKNEAIKRGEKAEEKIYQAGKKTLPGWRNQKEAKTKKQVSAWLEEKGWIAAVLPEGLIALDVDSLDPAQRALKFSAFKDICGNTPYGLHETKNGYHFVFKSTCEYSANKDTMTKAGFYVTYRPAEKTNIIVEPTPTRRWLRLVNNEDLPMLPELLQPINFEDIVEVQSALAMQLGYCFRFELLGGNDHIDMPFMHFLVSDCARDWETVRDIFQEIYVLEYEEHKTRINFDRVQKKEQKALTIDTLLKVLHENKLKNVITLINHYGALASNNKSSKFLPVVHDEGPKRSSLKFAANKYSLNYAEDKNINYINGCFYRRFEDFTYRKIKDERDIRKDFANWLGDAYESKRVEEMLKNIKDKKHMHFEPNFAECLMENGKVLNFKTLQVRDPHENDIFLYKAAGTYDANAKCPRFFTFLEEIFPENTQDHIDFFQRYIGYIFYPQNKFELALIFRGEGSNGKSVFMDMIEKIVGTDNVSHIGLGNLNDKNDRTHLVGKLLNMNAEIGSRLVVDDDVVKTLVSGESMTAKHLYKDSFEFKPFCKFIYASNNAVTSLDRSHGYERRILFIDFNVNFDTMPHKKDPNLRQKLYAEMDGIFTWAIRGLQKVLAEDVMRIPESMKLISKKEHTQNNPLYEFLSEHVVWSLQPDAKVFIIDLYLEFKKFCAMNGYKNSNKINFSKNLRRLLSDSPLKDLEHRNNSKRGFKNMWLIPTYYNQRTGEIDAPEYIRKITPSCEKSVTEMNFNKFQEWRKESLKNESNTHNL